LATIVPNPINRGRVVGHADWMQRLQQNHLQTAWIGQARSVPVFYDLSEPEMRTLEEVTFGSVI